MKRVRVLVVDDYRAWRSVICSTLGQRSYLSIVGEAEDGSEAVEKIGELLPDLILLDIGLPKLNGLEVVSRATELCPQSKVLMVSEMQSADIAGEAFRRGARGYVVKSAAVDELSPAVDAVLAGRQFISTHLSGKFSVDPEKSSSHPRNENVISPSPSRNSRGPARHEVEFYPGDAAYVAGLSSYVETRLRSGNPVILFSTASHRKGILQSLRAGVEDIDALIDRGSLVMLDSFEALSRIMVDGKPDPVRCEQVLTALMNGAGNSAATPVVFCGECAPVLLSQGNVEGAVQLEHLWERITGARGAETFCGYISSAVPVEDRAEIIGRICAEHSRAYGLESTC